MKNKIGLFILCFFLVATQQGQAQTKASNIKAELAARKAEREKRINQIRVKATEQKEQLQYEKTVEASGAVLPPARNGNGQGTGTNGSTGTSDAAAVSTRVAAKESAVVN